MPVLIRLITLMLACCIFLTLLLTGCSRVESPQPPPVRSSWAEQFAAAERAVNNPARDLILVQASARPIPYKQIKPNEPIEMLVSLTFTGDKSSGADKQSRPLYPSRFVRYNDHRLATTLRAEAEETQVVFPPDPKAREAARLIKVSPQDVLQSTLAEGQAYSGKSVDAGNMDIFLLPASEIPPELNALAVWEIIYYRDANKHLSILVDAQTGAILKRSTIEK